jgi:hypothetical protein
MCLRGIEYVGTGDAESVECRRYNVKISKVKLSLSLPLTKHHTMQAYWGVDV